MGASRRPDPARIRRQAWRQVIGLRRDEVTNDNLCVVSVGADDDSGIVSGGAGPTVEAARDDAFRHAADADAALDPGARVLVSACP